MISDQFDRPRRLNALYVQQDIGSAREGLPPSTGHVSVYAFYDSDALEIHDFGYDTKAAAAYAEELQAAQAFARLRVIRADPMVAINPAVLKSSFADETNCIVTFTNCDQAICVRHHEAWQADNLVTRLNAAVRGLSVASHGPTVKEP